jgi:hypothetical protein
MSITVTKRLEIILLLPAPGHEKKTEITKLKAKTR